MKNSLFTKRVLWVSILIYLTLLVFGQASAESGNAKSFFEGKTGEIASGGKAGGGNDLLSRLLAPYLKKYTGATYIVKNKTRAGSVEAGNSVWNAKPNGLTIGVTTSLDLILGSMMDDPGIQFDIKDMEFLGGVGSEAMILLAKAGSPYQTIEGLKAAKGIFLGSTHLTGNTGLSCLTAIDVLNLDAKLIYDLKGSKGAELALMQGEIAAIAFPVGNAMQMIKGKDKVPLAVIGVERDPALPGVPSLAELARLSDKQRQILTVWTKNLMVSKAIITSPKVPKERVNFLRSVMDSAFSDPKFVKEYNATRGGIEQPFIPGKVWEQNINELMQNLAPAKKTFSQYIKPYVR